MKLKRKIKHRHLYVFVVLRILLAFILIFSVLQDKTNLVLFLFVFTVGIAFIDGFMAKRVRLVSQFRSLFDPFADKVLIIGLSLALYFHSTFPLWLLLVYTVKDVFFVTVVLVMLIRNPSVIFRSNLVDKICAFIQMLVLGFFLIGEPDMILLWISVVFVAASLIVSFFRSGIKIVRYRTDLQTIRFRNLIKVPDLFTFGNILSGLVSIFFVLRGYFFQASIALLISVAFDYLDGKVAAMMHTERDFGKHLDSLADTVSFGIATALFGFALNQSLLAIVAFTLFIFAGVLRLARYNIMEFSGEKEYTGMPITVNGIIVPLLFLFKVPFVFYPYVYLALAIAMVSPFSVKKIL